MDAVLGLAFTRTGPLLYPLFGTMLGWLGVALTGSDTSSNVLFGNLQKITAEKLGLSPILMASANTTGGVMGKMIDAQSIVVAAAATGEGGREGELLREGPLAQRGPGPARRGSSSGSMPASSTSTPGPWWRRPQLDEKTQRNPLRSTSLGSRPLLEVAAPDPRRIRSPGVFRDQFPSPKKRKRSRMGLPSSKGVPAADRPQPTLERGQWPFSSNQWFRRTCTQGAICGDRSSRSCPNHWMGGLGVTRA